MLSLFHSLVLAAAPSEADFGLRDASIDVEGRLLDARFEDVDSDGRLELLLVVRREAGRRREIRIHPLTPEGVFARTPTSVVPVLDDVIAYGLADVRAEPGRELVFLTRKGVWSMSTTRAELRDNVRPLVEADLVYEVPDLDELPFWEYVLPGRRAALVVPGETSFSVWAPSPDVADAYVRAADFARATNAGKRDDHGKVAVRHEASVRVGGSSVNVDYGEQDPKRVLLDSNRAERTTLLSFERTYRAPALGDVNGDGRTDLLVEANDELWVHVATEAGIPPDPTRIEPWPDYLAGVSRIELCDVDADGDADLFYSKTDGDDGGGFGAEVFTLGVLLNDGERMFPPQPDQLMRFEAVELRWDVGEKSGDGKPDLVVRKFELPSMLDVVTRLDFKHTTLLYRGTGGGRDGRVFERKPSMKSERTYDENSIQDVIARRDMSHDFSGDGIADLVEVDSSGRVSLRRLLHRSSFFGGESWTLETSPWKRFDARGSIASLDVGDFNGDGLGDVASIRGDGLLLLLSTGKGGRR